MKLIKQIIERSLEKYDEARINKKFSPETYYLAIQLCAISLGKQMDNADLINELYSQYQKSKLNPNKQKEKILISQLKKEMLKDAVYIEEFRKKFRKISIEDNSHTNFYHKKAIGILAVEDSS